MRSKYKKNQTTGISFKQTSTSGDKQGNKDHSRFYSGLFIAIITLLIYIPALKNGFVDGWDDSLYILENKNIHYLGWDFLRWALFDTKLAAYWHPITWLSHAIDYYIWGSNPFGHHLTSLLIHSLNTVVVIWMTNILFTLAYKCRPPKNNNSILDKHGILIAASITGLLFGLHPLHVESTAWIAQRKDLLYSLFYMLSIINYIQYTQELEAHHAFYVTKRYYITLSLFILALSSKPMAVTLPAVLLLLDWYPLKRIAARKPHTVYALEKVPFIVLSFAVSLFSIIAQKADGSLKSLEAASFLTRILVAFRALMLYLVKLVAPTHLLPFYPYPKDASFGSPEYLSAIFVVTIITALSIFTIKKQPHYITVWGYFVITVSPVLGFFQAGGQSMADRYIYLSSIGPFILVGLGVVWVWSKVSVNSQNGYSTKMQTASVIIALATYLSYLSYMTVMQISIWQNSIVLWSYFIEKEPGLRDGYYSRAEAFRRNKQFNLALNDYSRAIQIAPDGSTYLNRGSLLFDIGLYDQALNDFNNTILLEPKSADAYTNRGNVYYKKGLTNLAISEYSTAIAIKPNFQAAYLNRAVTYRDRGDIDKAIVDFSTALTLGEDSMNNVPAIYIGRGDLHLKKGSLDLALQDYQKACNMGSKTACNKVLLPFQTN